jgi:hypothetical protein
MTQKNPYQVQGPGVPEMLGRRRLRQQVDDLLTGEPSYHVSVVGPSLYGKSVLLNDLATHPPKGYASALYWDLSIEVPTDDADFRRTFAGKLRAVASSGSSAAGRPPAGLDDGTELASAFREVLRSHGRLLVVLDSIDDTLENPNVTRDLWDDLYQFGQSDLRFVTGSRARILGLTKGRPEEGPPLRFHELFYPEEVTVGPFELEDWNAFLAPMLELLPPDPDIAGNALADEMRQWSGGVPILAAALAEKLVRSARNTEAIADGGLVNQIAEQMVTRGAHDAIRRFHNGLREELRDALAYIGDEGHARMSRPLGTYAERFGLARRTARTSEAGTTTWESACRLVTTFASRQSKPQDLDHLFGEPEDYDRNIVLAMKARYQYLKSGSGTRTADTWHHVRDLYDEALKHLGHQIRGLESATDANMSMGSLRSLLERLLEVIIRVEFDVEDSSRVPSGLERWKRGWPYVDDTVLANGDRRSQRLTFIMKAAGADRRLGKSGSKATPTEPFPGEFKRVTGCVSRMTTTLLPIVYEGSNAGAHAQASSPKRNEGWIEFPHALAATYIMTALELCIRLKKEIEGGGPGGVDHGTEYTWGKLKVGPAK